MVRRIDRAELSLIEHISSTGRRGLHSHIKAKRKAIMVKFLLLFCLMVLSYIFFLYMDQVEFFQGFLYKGAISLIGRSLLFKFGCSSVIGVGLAILSVLLGTEHPIGNSVLPGEGTSENPPKDDLSASGSDSANSGNWRGYLNLPEEENSVGGGSFQPPGPYGEGTSGGSGSPSLSEQFPILRMETPEFQEMLKDYEAVGPSHPNQGVEAAGPSTSNPPAPLSQHLQENRRITANPWPPYTPNTSMVSSMHLRIISLENENSPFLLDKEKGEYWREVNSVLTNSSSQKEYNRLLDFENRDLEIRELKQSCYRNFNIILENEPSLSENAGYKPFEMFKDYLDDQRTKLDEMGGDVVERDLREKMFLNQLKQDLQRNGKKSNHIKEIF